MFLIRLIGLHALFNATTGDAPTGAGAAPPVAGTPPAPAAPATPPPTPAPPAAPSTTAQPAGTPAAPERDPNWINDRIARAKKSAETGLLRELGVESLEDAKTAISELTAKRNAEKTASQKATEYETALKAERARIASLTEAVTAHASAQLATLTDEQRAAVTAIAGEDPAAQLKTLEALRPTWKAAAPAAAASTATPTGANPSTGTPPPAGTTPAAPAAPATPPPADTAPAPSAPKDSHNISPADPKAVYAELKKTNPVVAARYAFAHGVHNSQ